MNTVKMPGFTAEAIFATYNKMGILWPVLFAASYVEAKGLSL